MTPPLSTIGIIGGGQLGRMMAQAAAALGYKTHIYTEEADAPASHVATTTTVAPYDDAAALAAFARRVAVVTFEFENIPPESLALLAKHVPVYPSAEVLHVCRNRNREKQFIRAQGIGTAPFASVASLAELHEALAALGAPAILKTAELGYDGKGQCRIERAEDAAAAWRHLGEVEMTLEGVVDFVMELSVVIVRDHGKRSAAYAPVQNIHHHHILARTLAPALIPPALQDEAKRQATRLADALELRGILAVEFFLTTQGQLLVNELAPRPHNSGHWTMDACVTGQFEQAIRAVCGLPLGNPAGLADAEMLNLIGDECQRWQDYLADPNAKLHLYGKQESRPGRKMGHVTVLKPLSKPEGFS